MSNLHSDFDSPLEHRPFDSVLKETEEFEIPPDFLEGDFEHEENDMGHHARKINNSSHNGKRPLTREELLQGKISLEEVHHENDPRLKSPDELLAKLIRGKSASETDADKAPSETTKDQFGIPDLSGLKKELEIERETEPVKDEAVELNAEPASPDWAEKSEFNEVTIDTDHIKDRGGMVLKDNPYDMHSELIELKRNHEREIAQWKEYAQNVQLWQHQVVEIIKNLKSELKKSRQGHSYQPIQPSDSGLQPRRVSSTPVTSSVPKGPSPAHRFMSWMKGLKKPSFRR